MGHNFDLSIANLGDLDGIAEVTNAALNLDLVVQELLEGGDVEDLVVGGLGSVDDELNSDNYVSTLIPFFFKGWGGIAYLVGDLLLLSSTGLMIAKGHGG